MSRSSAVPSQYSFASSSMSRTLGSRRARHCVQSLRTRRCASTPRSASAKLNGSMPRSRRRTTLSAALFVWSVESTRCPVSEASIAILLVSASRISPTMMTSGSARMKLLVERPKALERDLAVLGLAALGDVELAHHLQPRDDGAPEPRRDLEVVDERAVFAETHAHALAGGDFDVDIGCFLLHRVDDHLVHQLDERAIGGRRLRLVGLVSSAFDLEALREL